MSVNTMTKQTRSTIWQIAFLLFVVLSGYALTTTGYSENPFDSIMAAIEIRQLAQESAEIDLPAPTFDTDIEIVFPEQEIGKASNWQISWSAFGDVLYDIWFLCAATAFVLLVRHPVRWLVRRATA